jgi:hypothetical protein
VDEPVARLDQTDLRGTVQRPGQRDARITSPDHHHSFHEILTIDFPFGKLFAMIYFPNGKSTRC